ncbi:MAG: sugar phosphate isomerase/epimerase [Planctomycetes bacterium]|nr:sugar phosphate isomerase/epimerase [Planctomycetota bacterium]
MGSFQYCLNTSTIRPTPLLDKIRIAGDVGYSAIELWHDDIEAYLDQGGRLSDIKKALADAGLQLPTTIYLRGWCDTTGAEHSKGLEECKKRLEHAATLGAIHSIASPAGGKVDVDLASRNYRELVELGLSFGVKPAMEYLGFVEQINTIESALEIMTRSGHLQATIIVDPFHNFRGGGDFASLAKLRGDQIAISHFNDTPSSPPRLEQHDHSRVLPGQGHLNLNQWVQLLSQSGYDRWLSLELFREDLWARDPKEVARIGLESMRAYVEGKGA